jgi:hypothetical protein
MERLLNLELLYHNPCQNNKGIVDDVYQEVVKLLELMISSNTGILGIHDSQECLQECILICDEILIIVTLDNKELNDKSLIRLLTLFWSDALPKEALLDDMTMKLRMNSLIQFLAGY